VPNGGVGANSYCLGSTCVDASPNAGYATGADRADRPSTPFESDPYRAASDLDVGLSSALPKAPLDAVLQWRHARGFGRSASMRRIA
jgi:hypothetical protein